jgi:hypothetical protein
MCDTDSMAIVASECGGLVACKGGPYRTPEGSEAIKALSWNEAGRIVGAFQSLNPYDPAIVPGSILNIVEELNFDSSGRQRQVYAYGISAKRHALYTATARRCRLSRPASMDWGFTTGRRKGVIHAATCQ